MKIIYSANMPTNRFNSRVVAYLNGRKLVRSMDLIVLTSYTHNPGCPGEAKRCTCM